MGLGYLGVFSWDLLRDKFDDWAGSRELIFRKGRDHGCKRLAICLHKQRRIDDLEDELKRLRAALGRQQRKAQEGFFGSSIPSSKYPLAN